VVEQFLLIYAEMKMRDWRMGEQKMNGTPALADPELQFRGPHSQRGARAYNGGLGAEPQRGPWAEPLVMGSVGRSPLKLKAF